MSAWFLDSELSTCFNIVCACVCVCVCACVRACVCVRGVEGRVGSSHSVMKAPAHKN